MVELDHSVSFPQSHQGWPGLSSRTRGGRAEPRMLDTGCKNLVNLKVRGKAVVEFRVTVGLSRVDCRHGVLLHEVIIVVGRSLRATFVFS